MKILLTAICISLATSTVSAAQPANSGAIPVAPTSSRIDLARQFIRLVNPADKMMGTFREAMWYGASADLDALEDEAERTEAEARLDKLLVAIEPKLHELIPAQLETYAQVYAREFSEDELRELVAFGQTPAGNHYLTRADFLDLDPAVLEAQQELMNGIAPIIQELKKQECAERAAKRLAAGHADAQCSLSAKDDTRAS